MNVLTSEPDPKHKLAPTELRLCLIHSLHPGDAHPRRCGCDQKTRGREEVLSKARWRERLEARDGRMYCVHKECQEGMVMCLYCLLSVRRAIHILSKNFRHSIVRGQKSITIGLLDMNACPMTARFSSHALTHVSIAFEQ